MAVHVAGIILLGKFLFHHFFEWAYAISATALIAFFAIAFINCIKQIELIKEIDYSKSITDIQTKLTLLQAHIVDYVRLTFLAIPTYLAYPILAFKALTNLDIVTLFATKWWTAQIIFSLLIIPVCVWLYRQVSYKNLHKKWVHFIIKNSVGNAVSNAMQFIKEIDEYKKENTQ